jgi:hypothetical protein
VPEENGFLKPEALSDSGASGSYLRHEAVRIARAGRKVVEFARNRSRSILRTSGIGVALVAATAAIGETSNANASAKTKICKPGNQIGLYLVGPREVTNSQKATTYKLKAESCNTTTPKQLKGVTLEEFGPGTEKHKWDIRQFPANSTEQERFNVTFPVIKAGEGATHISSERITLEALNKGKRIGFSINNVEYDPHVGSTGATGSTGPTGSTGSSGSTMPPGIYLTGPRDVSLRTPYDYQIEVLPAQSYKDVGIWISEPESNSIQHEMANLTANKPWIYDLTTEFDNTQHLNDTGISVSVVANSGVIYFQDFPMTLDTSPATPSN